MEVFACKQQKPIASQVKLDCCVLHCADDEIELDCIYSTKAKIMLIPGMFCIKRSRNTGVVYLIDGIAIFPLFANLENIRLRSRSFRFSTNVS